MDRRLQQPGPKNIRAAVARARATGRLNICNMQLSKIICDAGILTEIPIEVYDYYGSTTGTGDVNFDAPASEEMWWNKVDLTKIEASSNSITSIDAEIANLPSLTSIDLHDNNINNISSQVATLAPVLKYLNLSRNNLTVVSAVLCDLTALQELDLSHNAAAALPDAIGNLAELRILLVNDNKLPRLPSGISFLSKLTVLNLSSNQLSELPPEIGGLLQLRQLFVSHNELMQLPYEISFLVHLEMLDASSNKLQKLCWQPSPGAASNVNLHTLLLSNNRIRGVTDEDIEVLQLFPQLKTLELGDNTISDLSDKFYLLFQLSRLSLINNQLEELPSSIGLLPKLEHFLLDGNPLRRLRRDIVKRGTYAVKEYLRSRVPDDELQRMRSEMGENVSQHSNLRASHGSAAANNDAESSLMTKSNASALPMTVESFFSSRAGSESRGKLMLSKTLLGLADELLWKTAANNKIFHVDLSHNALTSAPNGLTLLCRTITELDLSNNSFTQLEVKTSSIAALENLVYLNLSRNKLNALFEDIPPSAAVKPNIGEPTSGDAENHIKTINESSPNILPVLRELDISFNNFTSLPAVFLRNKSKLEILNAGNNRIRLVNAVCLRSLPRLATLDLTNNDIERVPPELGLCSSINLLKLEGNAFRVPRYDVLSKGTQAVMEYLRSRVAS